MAGFTGRVMIQGAGIFVLGLILTLATNRLRHGGCFSTNPTDSPATYWDIIRDSGFLVLGGYLLLKIITNHRLDQLRNPR